MVGVSCVELLTWHTRKRMTDSSGKQVQGRATTIYRKAEAINL